MITMARRIFSGELKKVEFMKSKIIWIVKYTSTAKFVENLGFSLTVIRQFKSKNSALEFMNNVKHDDAISGTYRSIEVCRC